MFFLPWILCHNRLYTWTDGVYLSLLLDVYIWRVHCGVGRVHAPQHMHRGQLLSYHRAEAGSFSLFLCSVDSALTGPWFSGNSPVSVFHPDTGILELHMQAMPFSFLWVLGTEFRSSHLLTKCFYQLSHHCWPFYFKKYLFLYSFLYRRVCRLQPCCVAISSHMKHSILKGLLIKTQNLSFN